MQLKSIEIITLSLLSINELYIVIPEVFYCDGTDFCNDFTLMCGVEVFHVGLITQLVHQLIMATDSWALAGPRSL